MAAEAAEAAEAVEAAAVHMPAAVGPAAAV